MSVIIKGMEMPKTCKECPFSDHEAWCLIPGDWRERYYMLEDERSEHCPLIELPPHGTLIDADELMTTLKVIREAEEQIYGRCNWNFAGKCINEIENAPTVLETEEAE